MPKRQNPFGDNSPLQFKSHITPKEVDLGVDKDRKMLLVYGDYSQSQHFTDTFKFQKF